MFLRGPIRYEIPETVWFSPATLRAKSKFGAVLDDPGFQELMTRSGSSHHKELAFAMLYERNLPKSHWGPYVHKPSLRLGWAGLGWAGLGWAGRPLRPVGGDA